MVILGGGSKLGNRVPMDLMAAGDIEDFEVVLVDIDPGRLELVSAYLQRAAEQHRKSLKIETTTDRRRAIEGADYVIIVISVGGPAFDGFPYYEEIMIPRKYGVDQSIGDTVNPGGVFRALRTAPVFYRDLARCGGDLPQSAGVELYKSDGDFRLAGRHCFLRRDGRILP